jgi:hypothetical protein
MIAQWTLLKFRRLTSEQGSKDKALMRYFTIH